MSHYDAYDMTIGIECHVQLATKTKLFSGADNDARDKEPNSVVSPIDYGLPGMLPILNQEAVRLAIHAGKALNASIAQTSRFDRKHYFYPDLPKGYQISQMYEPIILSGFVDTPLDDGSSLRVGIHHAHMEEDAGKLTHHSGYSLVDLNRAGTPLIEIVSEPDIHSAEAARAYASELHRLMTYAGVTHGDLYHGNMRFDVNVSVAKKGATELGTRAEVKNLNSFRSVERAAEYEFKRQIDIIEAGGVIVQETRGWDDTTGKTTSQRSKEDAQDYRYMPDADIPPIILTREQIAAVQATTPILPSQYRVRWQPLELDEITTRILFDHQLVAELIDELSRPLWSDAPVQSETELTVSNETRIDLIKRVINWFVSTPSEQMDYEGIRNGLVGADRLLQLSLLVEKQLLSSTNAKELFLFLFDETSRGQAPETIADQRDLLQVSDERAVADVVERVLADPASAASIADIRAGKDKAIGYLVGQVMKQSGGKANPALAQKLIRERLET